MSKSKSRKDQSGPKYKQGRISKTDVDYITKHMYTKTDIEMANALNRRVDTIIDIKTEMMARGQGVEEKDGKIEIVGDLHKRPEWPIWKQQFTQEELALFKVRYSQLIAQFNNDVMITEDIQLLQAIQFEILMNRALIEKRTAEKSKAELEDIMNDLRSYAAKETDKTQLAELNRQKVDLSNNIASISAGLKESSREYRELQDKHSKLMQNLKATRNQRFEQVEKSGDSVIDLIKYLSERDNQERESRNHELIKLGVAKEEKRLSGLHTFQDGTLENILLTPEVVLEQQQAKEDE